MNIILLGPPGSGKGTQAEVFSARLKIPSISTGNILRDAIQRGSAVGLSAKAYVDAGRLVPDEVILDVISERLSRSDCMQGFILDGFPRTVPQAEALDALSVRIDIVLSLEVPDDMIKARMSGRRSCTSCGASYHLEHHKPREDNVCDLCGASLYRRTDDDPDTVQARLSVYHAQTEPVKGYYEAQGKLRVIAAGADIERVTQRCLDALETAG